MAQQDEVSGLRDIIRHDQLMDAFALEKLEEARTLLRQIEHPSIHLIDIKLGEVDRGINSTLADAQKNPGVAVQLEIIQ